MATKLYFHNATNALTGTFPVGEQGAATPLTTFPGATTLRTMDTTIGVAQVNLTYTGNNDKGPFFIGFFCSQPLATNQTVGGGTMILNAATAQGNLTNNFWLNLLNIYVWRPSTNTKVGTIRDASSTATPGLGALEPTAINSEQVDHISGITSSAVSALAGDVIICELWSADNNGGKNNTTSVVYFDGTTENTTENAVVSNHASYIQLAETLIFGTLKPRSFAVII